MWQIVAHAADIPVERRSRKLIRVPTVQVMTTVRDLPRERLVALGAVALSDAELVAIQLGTGSEGRDMLELARTLLSQYGGVGGLATLRWTSWRRRRGSGQRRRAGWRAGILNRIIYFEFEALSREPPVDRHLCAAPESGLCLFSNWCTMALGRSVRWPAR